MLFKAFVVLAHVEVKDPLLQYHLKRKEDEEVFVQVHDASELKRDAEEEHHQKDKLDELLGGLEKVLLIGNALELLVKRVLEYMHVDLHEVVQPKQQIGLLLYLEVLHYPNHLRLCLTGLHSLHQLLGSQGDLLH